MIQIKERFAQERRKIGHEMRQKIAGYIVGAFGLVAGLAWNDAIQTLINEVFKINKNTITAKFIYAGGITMVLVIVSVYVVRFFEEKEQQEIPAEKKDKEREGKDRQAI